MAPLGARLKIDREEGEARGEGPRGFSGACALTKRAILYLSQPIRSSADERGALGPSGGRGEGKPHLATEPSRQRVSNTA